MQEDQKTIQQILSKNHISEDMQASQFTSGQINRVYDIGGQYVLKLEGDLHYAKGIYIYQPTINQALIAKGAKVPRILDYGSEDGREYLLMEKVKGKTLAGYLAARESYNAKKENFIAQIAEQLKIYHSLHFNHYAVQLRRDEGQKNWQQAVDAETDFSAIDKSKLKPEYAADVEFLEGYYAQYKSLLDEQRTAVFTHNDVHFENILFEGDTITGIIDFDWCSYAPRDYELRKLVDFTYMPDDYFGDEPLWPLYKDVKLVDELRWLKKYYPELFSGANFEQRVNVYFISHLLHAIKDYQEGRYHEDAMVRVHQRIEDIFRNRWVQSVLL